MLKNKGTNFLIIIAIYSLVFSSCSPYNYQLFETNSYDLTIKDNKYYYEDDNCRIIYDLWGNKGENAFIFHNKTDQIISIDKEQSFFEINGISNDYYSSTNSSISKGSQVQTLQSRTQTTTNNVTSKRKHQTSTFGASSSYNKSLEIIEKKEVKVPPKSSKVLFNFNLVQTRYKHCDLHLYPTKIDSVSFTKENTPYYYKNFITYKLKNSNREKFISNSFYVNKISNIKYADFYYYDNEIGCDGKKSVSATKFFKYISKKNFFLTYKAM